ncbi:hypothetical protein Taro_046346 [Colocasia esculenta]|uniref:DUF4378 domain-containing protein n=1 Tax=Colocasia esculenta TaxID=4460 RepID=A0A843WS36_COLES|nr:hypothetical protein [Colocasia esculenta]
MAKQAHHRNPKLGGDGLSAAGCLRGLFNSFDVHQRFRLPKMLGDRRSAHRRHATGGKEPKTKTEASHASDERDPTEADANISSPVEDRVEPPTGKTSGKSRRKPSIAQEMSRQQDMPKHKGGHKRKVTPFATRLLRTISIHHLESDDYGHPNEVPEASQLQDPSLLPHSYATSTGNERTPTCLETHDEVNKGNKRCDACGTATPDPAGHVCHKKLDELGCQLLEKQALLREKLREAKESLQGQREGDGEPQENVARRHSSDILEALELFHANNELFLKLLREPDSDMASDSQGGEDPKGGRVLTRCGSFPGAGSSSIKGSSFKLKDEVLLPSKKLEASSETEKLQTLPGIGNPEVYNKSQFMGSSPRPASPLAHGILETASSSEPSSTFAPVEKRQRDNGSAAHRFRVIKQRIKDIIKDNKKERRRIAMDRVLHKVPVDKFCSSDRFDGESSRFSFGCDAGVSTCRISFSSIPRSQSLSESVEKYAHLLESTSRREPSKPQVSERLKLADEDGGSQVTQAPRTFGRIFSLPEFEACFHKDDQHEASLDLFSHSKPGSADPAKGNEEECKKDVKGGVDEQNLSRSRDHRGLPASVLLDDEADAASGAVTTQDISYALSDEQVSVPCAEAGGTPEEPSSTAAAVDSNLAEYPVTTAESSVFQAAGGSEPELEIDQVHSEGQDDPSDNQHETDEVSNASDAQVSGAPLDFDILPVPVDQHEIEFNYVKDVLKAYLFDSNELSQRWSSPSKPPDPSVSEEVDASAAHEPEPSNMYPQFNLDRELLYDLTNQILIEICENSYGHTPWLSNMWGSHTRPVPVGFHLLEEVWANISWHLKAHPHANPTLEYMLERDFRKNDGWMNLNHDVEYVGLDLEATLLDDLIDETLFEVLDWDYVECPVS